MARVLTTPEVQPDAVQQHVSGLRFEIPAIRDGGDTEMVISKDQVKIWYEVITYDSAGNIIERESRIVQFADWTPAFVTDMKAVYAKVYTDAENAGLIAGPGTDEPLE